LFICSALICGFYLRSKKRLPPALTNSLDLAIAPSATRVSFINNIEVEEIDAFALLR